MKYYIASALENIEVVRRVRDYLKSFGHEITYDWTSHGPVWSKGLKVCEEVCQLEINGVLNADIVIVLWPGGRGTHAELGMSIVAGKRIIFYSPVTGHHTPSSDLCIFYLHPLVEHVQEWNTLIEKLAFLE